MKTMFRTTDYLNQITEFEVIKTTDKSIYFINKIGKEERELRNTNYYNWFETKEEAVNFHKERLNKIIISSENKISRAKEELKKLEDENN